MHIAICCQGGGSHTAFTGGALSLLYPAARKLADRVTLTGTSGGAICAAIASASDEPGEALRAFWQAMRATSPADACGNFLLTHVSGLLPLFSPYANPMQPAEILRAVLKVHCTKTPRDCLIGACDVLSGEFVVFKDVEIGIDQLLASCTVPQLFPATEIDGAYYWDGLFSQNPPIADIFDLDEKPDEVWVIRVEPRTRAKLPVTAAEIEDRSKELAFSNALEHELKSVERINRWLAAGVSLPGYKTVNVRQLTLDLDVDNASKLDRTPSFIDTLFQRGETVAQEFLATFHP